MTISLRKSWTIQAFGILLKISSSKIWILRIWWFVKRWSTMEYLMDKPIFLLTKFRNLSKENEKDWINVIQSTKSPKKKRLSALIWNGTWRKKPFGILLKMLSIIWILRSTNHPPSYSYWQKLSKSWRLWQKILMLQMIQDGLQFFGQKVMEIQKLSKSWPL